MHAKDFLIYNRRYRQAVEAIRESLPKLNVVPSLALVVKAVNSVNGRALMVASEDEEVLGELDLEREHEADRLEALLATVDVVTAFVAARRTGHQWA